MREILRGDRSAVSLSSLLQLAEGEGITGWLVLSSEGRVGFRLGDLVAARYGDLSGRAALYEIFISSGGTFSLQLDDEVEGASLGNLVGLIMQGVRLADEWARLAPMRLGIQEGAELPKSDTPVGRVVRRLNGRRTVRQAVSIEGVPISSVVDPLFALIEGFAVTEVSLSNSAGEPTEGRESGEEEQPESSGGEKMAQNLQGLRFHELLNQGRTYLKNRDFEAAEACFKRALALRPGHGVVQQNLKRLDQLRYGADNTSPYQWYRR